MEMEYLRGSQGATLGIRHLYDTTVSEPVIRVSLHPYPHVCEIRIELTASSRSAVLIRLRSTMHFTDILLA